MRRQREMVTRVEWVQKDEETMMKGNGDERVRRR